MAVEELDDPRGLAELERPVDRLGDVDGVDEPHAPAVDQRVRGALHRLVDHPRQAGVVLVVGQELRWHPDVECYHAAPIASGITGNGIARQRSCATSPRVNPASSDEGERVLVAAAAAGERAPRAEGGVLRAGQPRVVGADVLDEEQATAGPEDAARLAQDGGDVLGGAEDHGRDDGVDARVGEGEGLGGRGDDGGLAPRLAETALEAGGRASSSGSVTTRSVT